MKQRLFRNVRVMRANNNQYSTLASKPHFPANDHEQTLRSSHTDRDELSYRVLYIKLTSFTPAFYCPHDVLEFKMVWQKVRSAEGYCIDFV